MDSRRESVSKVKLSKIIRSAFLFFPHLFMHVGFSLTNVAIDTCSFITSDSHVEPDRAIEGSGGNVYIDIHISHLNLLAT